MGHPELDQHRPDRVSDRRQQDGPGAQELPSLAGDIDSHEHDHAAEPEQKPQRTDGRRPLGRVQNRIHGERQSRNRTYDPDDPGAQ